MERKIKEINNYTQPKLRKYFNTIYTTEHKNITQICKWYYSTFNERMGKNEMYESIKTKYNSDIDKPVLMIEKIIPFIKTWFETNNKDKSLPFEIKFCSVKMNVKWWLKYNSYYQFEKTFEKMIRNGVYNYAHGKGGSDLLEETEEENSTNEFYSKKCGIKIDKVRLISGGCNKTSEEKITTEKKHVYEIEFLNLPSQHNECFFKCIRYFKEDIEEIKDIRKRFEIKRDQKITIEEGYKIIKYYKLDIKIVSKDELTNLKLNQKYIYYNNQHYKIIKKLIPLNKNKNKTKRGMMTVDLETRATEDFTSYTRVVKKKNEIPTIELVKMHKIKETIGYAVYKDYKIKGYKSRYFKTDKDSQNQNMENNKTAMRKFIDFLNEQSINNKTYNIIAHYGRKFDYYLMIQQMTKEELNFCDIRVRGFEIINIRYLGNNFIDSGCFLTDSLDNLGENFQVKNKKLKIFQLHGESMTSKNLCFYKPELSFEEFLELEEKDPEYWEEYKEYCLYDCISLIEIWKKFEKTINLLIHSVNPFILSRCPLMGSFTIGSHCKKINMEINKYKGEENNDIYLIKKFLGYKYVKTETKIEDYNKSELSYSKNELKQLFKNGEVKKVYDMEKYKFVSEFKVGGISHCNKKGKHTYGITSVDICSQYPIALLKCRIPYGESKWVDKTYNPEENLKDKGFYHLKNVEFKNEDFKVVCQKIKNKSLNWASKTIEDLYIDSYTLNYLRKNYEFSYNFEKGLVSVKQEDISGEKIFGKFINTFYKTKQEEDKNKDELKNINLNIKNANKIIEINKYKENNKYYIKLQEYKNHLENKKTENKYNEALRSTIKLYLNSLSGKLVEDPQIHFSLKFSEFIGPINKNDKKTVLLNGVRAEKYIDEDNVNGLLTCGVMIYSYSKRLLFEYINCLPNKSKDVIHVETDGIYFPTPLKKEFEENLKNYTGKYKEVKFGEDLGNIKIEKNTKEGQVAYFLAKKFYCITSKKEPIFRIKGIRQKTIDPHGNEVKLVDIDLYEDIFSGESVTRSWLTLKKSLFVSQTNIKQYTMSRTIKLDASEFKTYSTC